MLRRLVYSIILAALGYWGYSTWQSSVEKNRQQVERQAQKEKLKSRITEVALKYGAVIDWPSRLTRENRLRDLPVLSAELQDLWINSKPILFVGKVRDIIRTSEEAVLLSIDYGWADPIFGHGIEALNAAGLRVKVQCANALAAPLIAASSSSVAYSPFSNVALVANIDMIESSTERGEKGEPIEVRTGTGKCIDIVLIPPH